ncbi:MAG TPA: hypothetical protein VFI69_01685 [Candidatus Limnocylindrales bacterium]|nr:hypothetical protein [Candidatus Limnocylindrales bacterium]
MNDEMIDLMAADIALRRRLEAYADVALSPDLAASSRMRARVLAVAHRQADLDGRDAGALTVLPGGGTRSSHSSDPLLRSSTRARSRGRRRRALSALLVAGLGIILVAGSAAAARPGGGLYDARLWVETMTLPSEPSARAVAELARLSERIREARDATAAGDGPAAGAALGAYERIITEATTAALSSGDAVAAAALEVGVAGNVAVLRELVGRIPPSASAAIGRALARAIDRSTSSVDAIGTATGSGHGAAAGGNKDQGGGASGGANGGDGGADGPGGGGSGPASATSKPTKAPTPTPTIKPAKPTATPTPAPTPKPTPKRGTGQDQKPEATPRSTPPPHPR